MDLYKIAIQNDSTKKKRYTKIRASKIEDAVKISNYNEVHHPTETLVKVERVDV